MSEISCINSNKISPSLCSSSQLIARTYLKMISIKFKLVWNKLKRTQFKFKMTSNQLRKISTPLTQQLLQVQNMNIMKLKYIMTNCKRSQHNLMNAPLAMLKSLKKNPPLVIQLTKPTPSTLKVITGSMATLLKLNSLLSFSTNFQKIMLSLLALLINLLSLSTPQNVQIVEKMLLSLT